MGDEWGPWIEHDGSWPPRGAREGMPISILASPESGYVRPTEECHARHFLWRWKAVPDGWFKTKRVRVCDDPSLMPIIRYRIRKPRGLTILEEIAQGIREPEEA